jgi:hypothetical protein
MACFKNNIFPLMYVKTLQPTTYVVAVNSKMVGLTPGF